ncbi:hypothetical protein [Streptomyces sp. LaPpAH-108]|uniref:hypothetical protein n=1 Tax=Streptomyces sp. LaPpAH-108 TaxID=1155714 RepID=UPI00037E1568|nr:hypothetical protein [Streptomyces sp. LaPpAH-108]
MDVILLYLLTLPTAIVVGWLLSWWGSRRVRRIVLGAGAVVCVLCVVVIFQSTGPPSPPRADGCSSALACTDLRPGLVALGGVIGLVCCFVLLLLTIGVEAGLARARRRRRAVSG